jgi:hypothetical protein
MNEAKWSVVAVVPRDDYTLDVSFSDGARKKFDVKPLLAYPAFKPLNDLSLFMNARVAFDSVAWGDSIDIAPESLYEKGISLA